jgi:tetratricopeptide (TPR) repeat protein
MQCVLALLAIVLVSATPPAPPEDLIRKGNTAVEAGDLEGADAQYAQAEERTADPGLVAFNKAIVSFKRGDFRRAELGFRRALADGDIPADRRARGLYNLGTSLVRQAGETDVKQLQAAIECYELVLAETTDEGLRSDAGHNLELAKLLWAKARSRRPPGERDPDWEEPRDPKQPPPDPAKNPDDPANEGNGDAKQPDQGAKLDVGKGKDKGVMPKETEKKAPGHGNLPVVPDKDQVESYAPDDARARLLQNVERIRKERLKLREEAGQGERPRANDW